MLEIRKEVKKKKDGKEWFADEKTSIRERKEKI